MNRVENLPKVIVIQLLAVFGQVPINVLLEMQMDQHLILIPTEKQRISIIIITKINVMVRNARLPINKIQLRLFTY
jgi:hypothetical protein